MRYANDMIPYTFTRAFALSFTERRRAKNMANQSNMQLSMLDIEQHELLLIAVAHKCMQLKRTISEKSPSSFICWSHTNGSCSTCGTLLSVLEIYIGYFSIT